MDDSLLLNDCSDLSLSFWNNTWTRPRKKPILVHILNKACWITLKISISSSRTMFRLHLSLCVLYRTFNIGISNQHSQLQTNKITTFLSSISLNAFTPPTVTTSLYEVRLCADEIKNTLSSVTWKHLVLTVLLHSNDHINSFVSEKKALAYD